MTDWTPSSWRQRPVAQPVIYDDDQQSVLEKTRSKLAQLPPLSVLSLSFWVKPSRRLSAGHGTPHPSSVQAAEIENLKAHLCV